MAYGNFKDLTRRTASDKILRAKAFNIAKNSKYDGYHPGLENENMSDQQLAEELFLL